MESAETPFRPSSEELPAEQLVMLRKKESLELSRRRVMRELEDSQNPRYRGLMQKALADLNAQLVRLEQGHARMMTA